MEAEAVFVFCNPFRQADFGKDFGAPLPSGAEALEKIKKENPNLVI